MILEPDAIHVENEVNDMTSMCSELKVLSKSISLISAMIKLISI